MRPIVRPLRGLSGVRSHNASSGLIGLRLHRSPLTGKLPKSNNPSSGMVTLRLSAAARRRAVGMFLRVFKRAPIQRFVGVRIRTCRDVVLGTRGRGIRLRSADLRRHGKHRRISRLGLQTLLARNNRGGIASPVRRRGQRRIAAERWILVTFQRTEARGRNRNREFPVAGSSHPGELPLQTTAGAGRDFLRQRVAVPRR